jgi:hypothetical protein
VKADTPKTDHRTVRKRILLYRRILRRFTLDNISKIAAIGTPIILGVGGWYLTDIWNTREENISTYAKTSAAIGKLSVSDAAAQRDVLFSIIQLGRTDVLKRVASYIEARIANEADAAESKIQYESKFDSPADRSQELAKPGKIPIAKN